MVFERLQHRLISCKLFYVTVRQTLSPDPLPLAKGPFPFTVRDNGVHYHPSSLPNNTSVHWRSDRTANGTLSKWCQVLELYWKSKECSGMSSEWLQKGRKGNANEQLVDSDINWWRVAKSVVSSPQACFRSVKHLWYSSLADLVCLVWFDIITKGKQLFP